MWWVVPTAYWNRAVGTNQIQAVDTGQGLSDHHITFSCRYRPGPSQYRPWGGRYRFPLELTLQEFERGGPTRFSIKGENCPFLMGRKK
jgi:hypothetical protein